MQITAFHIYIRDMTSVTTWVADHNCWIWAYSHNEDWMKKEVPNSPKCKNCIHCQLTWLKYQYETYCCVVFTIWAYSDLIYAAVNLDLLTESGAKEPLTKLIGYMRILHAKASSSDREEFLYCPLSLSSGPWKSNMFGKGMYSHSCQVPWQPLVAISILSQ